MKTPIPVPSSAKRIEKSFLINHFHLFNPRICGKIQLGKKYMYVIIKKALFFFLRLVFRY
jgi:hypothetical protein